MSFDLTPISVKDFDGEEVPMIAYNDATNSAFAHAVVDATGAIISPATSGLQTTGNSALATIVTQTNGLATAAAQTTANTSAATTATNTGNLDTNMGAKADAAASSDSGTFSLISLFKRLLATSTAISTACQSAIPAGTNTIGTVLLPGSVHLTAAPTVTAGAYTTGQVVGGLISLTGAARSTDSQVVRVGSSGSPGTGVRIGPTRPATASGRT